MTEIGRVLSTVPAFGETNAVNKELYDAAQAAGILVDVDALLGEGEA